MDREKLVIQLENDLENAIQKKLFGSLYLQRDRSILKFYYTRNARNLIRLERRRRMAEHLKKYNSIIKMTKVEEKFIEIELKDKNHFLYLLHQNDHIRDIRRN